WGHVAPGTQMHGKDGLMRVVGQLQGLELPAPAWEERILPARIQRYNPADLEHLCLSGVVTWGRLSTGGAAAADEELDEDLPPKARSRHPGPVRSSPLAFVLREDLPLFLVPATEDSLLAGLPAAARAVAEDLAGGGTALMASARIRVAPQESEASSRPNATSSWPANCSAATASSSATSSSGSATPRRGGCSCRSSAASRPGARSAVGVSSTG